MFPVTNQTSLDIYNYYDHNLEREVEEEITSLDLSPESINKTMEKIRRLPLEIISKNSQFLDGAVSNCILNIGKNCQELTDKFYKFSEELLLAGCDVNLISIQGLSVLRKSLDELCYSIEASCLFGDEGFTGETGKKRIKNYLKLTKLLLSFGAEKKYCYYYDENQKNKILVNNNLPPKLIQLYKNAKKSTPLNLSPLLKLSRIHITPSLPLFLFGRSDKNSFISSLPKEIVAQILTSSFTSSKMTTSFHVIIRENNKKAEQVEQ